MSDLTDKLTNLADAIRGKSGTTGKLTIDGMVSAVEGINLGGSGDSSVKFGYWTADGKFQEVDLSSNTPTDTGSPVTADAVIFDTGKETPSYGGNDDSNVGASIEFYECTNYIPEADAYTKWSFTLSGLVYDENANGTYVRTEWIDDLSDLEDSTITAKWVNANNYTLTEEYGYGEFYYNIRTPDGGLVLTHDGSKTTRVTENYSNIVDWIDMNTWEYMQINCSSWDREEVPAVSESWSGYLILQNTQDGTWSKTDQFFEGLEAKGYMPKPGKIYSKDTTVACTSLLTVAEGSLVALYHFDEDYVDATGNTTASSSDKYVSASEVRFGTGSLCGDCHMNSDGSTSYYLEITGLPELDAFTVEWWQYDNWNYGDGSSFLCQPKTDDLPVSVFPALTIPKEDPEYITGKFKHWAFVREAGTTEVSVYLNGKIMGYVYFKDKLGGRVIRFTGVGSVIQTQTKGSYIDELAFFNYPKYRKNFTPPDEPYVV